MSARTERIAQRKAEWFATRPCVRCGATEQLQVDHIDPAQKDPRLRTKQSRGFGPVWEWSEERRARELAKCQSICRPCHILKTNEDRGCAK